MNLTKSSRSAAYIIFAALLSIAENSIGADISIREHKEKTSCRQAIDLEGEIIPGDEKILESKILSLHKIHHNATYPDQCYGGNLILHLNSKGGNVMAAIALGRVARKYELTTVAHECASSCVFLFIAGVKRLIFDGYLAVHQPYFERLNPKYTRKDIAKIRSQLNSSIAAYIAEMNVSANLLEIMLSVPPERTRRLSMTELETLRIVGDDPDFKEKDIAERAYTYGISSSQYRERELRVDRFCNANQRVYSDCRESILLGVSQKAAAEITERVYKQCIEGIQDGVTTQAQINECIRKEYMRGRQIGK
jgi:hypothetical protein